MFLPNEDLKKSLLESGYVSESQYEDALNASRMFKLPVVEVILSRGLIQEETLGEVLSKTSGLPFAPLKNKIDPKILNLIPAGFANKNRCLIFDANNKEVSVATSDPDNMASFNQISQKTGRAVKLYFTLPSLLNRAMGQYRQDIAEGFKSEITKTASLAANTSGVNIGENINVVRTFDKILQFAAAKNASDIHIVGYQTRVIIRFRINGRLRDILELPKNIQPGLIARIKILSSLKIDEHRLPQDGRFRFDYLTEQYSVRVSILPLSTGEDAVLRLLSDSSAPKSLEDLGLRGKNLQLMKEELEKPQGMILSTGPTGSGKTTTLYNLLKILNKEDVNIITIEDPVEYTIDRVNQIQVNNTTGLTFASGLRSILRHDPDIILVGEIRDSETADIAIHSALTGHLVLSTLHTNDAPTAIPRFEDLGIEPFLLASTLSIVIAQRLVRRLDPNKIESYQVPETIIERFSQYLGKELATKLLSETNFYQPKSDLDPDEVFIGRIAVFEILKITPKIRELIQNKASLEQLTTQAKLEGFTTMLEDGIDKAAAGLTTLEEVLDVVSESVDYEEVVKETQVKA